MTRYLDHFLDCLGVRRKRSAGSYTTFCTDYLVEKGFNDPPLWLMAISTSHRGSSDGTFDPLVFSNCPFIKHTHTYVRIGLEAARTDGGAAAAAVGLLGLTNVNFVYMLNFRK